MKSESLFSDTDALVIALKGAETKNEEWRYSLANSINNLLVAYGATMDNRDHGKNLMHKLLLEGRLILRGIQVD